MLLLQDPNARNCHGYRKFVKRSVLENLNNGYLVNDTIVIKYTIETGGVHRRRSDQAGWAQRPQAAPHPGEIAASAAVGIARGAGP